MFDAAPIYPSCRRSLAHGIGLPASAQEQQQHDGTIILVAACPHFPLVSGLLALMRLIPGEANSPANSRAFSNFALENVSHCSQVQAPAAQLTGEAQQVMDMEAAFLRSLLDTRTLQAQLREGLPPQVHMSQQSMLPAADSSSRLAKSGELHCLDLPEL